MATPQRQERARISEYINRSSFLNTEDALDIGKIRLFAGRYRAGNGASQQQAHYVDVYAIRPILDMMRWGRAINYKEYKGSPQGENGPISRALSIRSKGDVVYLELASGPGKVTATGAIQPAGAATTCVTIAMSKEDARRWAADLLEYLIAWRVARMISPQRPQAQPQRPQPQPAQPGPAQPQPQAEGEKVNLFRFEYGDGTAVPEAAREHFTSYRRAHGEKVPANRTDLVAWCKQEGRI